jgi:hypothetical protein
MQTKIEIYLSILDVKTIQIVKEQLTQKVRTHA